MNHHEVLVTCVLCLTLAATAGRPDGLKAAEDAAPPAAPQLTIANLNADWQLSVVLDHPDGVYQVGENMTLAVKAPRTCHLHILNVTPNGDIRVLWPLKAGDPNLVEAGEKVMFPDPAWSPKVKFVAEAPVGKELIVCLATMAPINLKDPEQAQKFETFLQSVAKVSPAPLARLRRFVTQVERNPNGWAAHALVIQTVMPGKQDESAKSEQEQSFKNPHGGNQPQPSSSKSADAAVSLAGDCP